MSTDTLQERAARYFGVGDKPRTLIRLNNTDCLIIAGGWDDRTLIMHYSEEYKPTGHFTKLTPRAKAELLKALEGSPHA